METGPVEVITQIVTHHTPPTVGARIDHLENQVYLLHEQINGDVGIISTKRRQQLIKRLEPLEQELTRLRSMPDRSAILPRRRYRRGKIIPAGMCQCGCGLRTPKATRTHRGRGWIKGQPLRYIRGHQPKRRIRF